VTVREQRSARHDLDPATGGGGSQRKPFPAGGRRERAQIEAQIARILAVPPGGAASGRRATGLAAPSGGAGAGERTLAVPSGGTGSERRA